MPPDAVDQSLEALRVAVDGSPDLDHALDAITFVRVSLSSDESLSDQSMEEGGAGAQDGDVDIEHDLASDLAADPAEQVSAPFASGATS